MLEGNHTLAQIVLDGGGKLLFSRECADLRGTRRYHQALQAAVLTDQDQCIGLALDALGVAYGILHQHNHTLHYCAIAADILQAAGDLEGAAIALQHSQYAAHMLQQSQ